MLLFLLAGLQFYYLFLAARAKDRFIGTALAGCFLLPILVMVGLVRIGKLPDLQETFVYALLCSVANVVFMVIIIVQGRRQQSEKRVAVGLGGLIIFGFLLLAAWKFVSAQGNYKIGG